MYISRRWLEKYISISSIKDEEITVALNSLGFEVDAYKTYSNLNDNLTIGQVGSVNKIEETHLNYCFVDLNEDLPAGIICGADNIKEGQFVLVATPGTKIANGLTITNREIYGKTSEGMVCALTELGMEESKLTDEEKNEIYIVNTRDDLHSYLGSKDALNIIGFNDSIWDCDLTLNRSDALASFQILKELANYFDVEIKNFSLNQDLKNIYKTTNKVEISITKSIEENILALSSFSVIKKEILSIDKSWKNSIHSEDDIWLKNCGAKTTNNLYGDLANIIAIETGQYPFFIDSSKIKNELKIVDDFDDGKENSGIKLMDGSEVVSLIGIDFNNSYYPSDDTKEVLVVLVALNPILMRKQQRKYNASSIAMQRFMKPLSSRLEDLAYSRIINLFDRYDILGQISELNYIKRSAEKEVVVEISQAFIDNLLGIELDSAKIFNLFKRLDFKIKFEKGIYTFEVDKYRKDIEMKADIVEEIARLYGYDNIEAKPLNLLSVKKENKINKNLQKQISSFLLGQGFANIKTYSLISKELNERWDLFNYKREINLAMPLSSLRESYRLSMFPSLIEAAISNSKYGNKNIKLFEIADIYNLNDVRDLHLGIAIVGNVLSSKAHKINIKSDWYVAKGYVETILGRYQIPLDDLEFNKITSINDSIHPHINSSITYKGKKIGFILRTNPKFESKNKLEPSFFVDLNLSLIEGLFDDHVYFEEISKFQRTSRDFTVVLPIEENYSKLIKEITKDINHLEGIKLSDIYIDEELEKSQKQSITVTLTFNSKDDQLNDTIVSSEFDKVLKRLNDKKMVIK